MPLPPPTFTKSKWLTFFAELSSKLTHHNVNVVIEGCEIYKRLLISRVSVGAFLEEGSMLEHLLNAASSAVQGEKPPTARDREMLHCLMQALSVTVDMMMSLYADGDEYHALLVLARSRIFLDGLTTVLKGRNREYFGFTCRLLQILLSLPLTAERTKIDIHEGVAAVRHVRALEEIVTSLPHAVQHLADVSLGIASVTTGAIQVCCWSIGQAAKEHIIQQQPETVPPDSSAMFPADQQGEEEGKENQPPAGLENAAFTYGVHESYQRFQGARSHGDCLIALNELWCFYVTKGEATSLLTGSDQAACMERFLRVSPRNSADEVVFRGILAWFSLLVTTQPITVDLQKALLNLCGTSLIPMLGSGSQNFVLEKPTTGYAVLSFLLTMAPCCPTLPMQDWLSAGLIGHIERIISNSREVSSTLVDAPSIVEGTLPDEIYLTCAKNMCRTETSTMAVVGMKLLCHVFQHHGRVLLDNWAQETMAVIQTVCPLCVQLIINNPTLQAPSRHAAGTGTLLHHYPKCQRACRPTSIGECAAVTLDACLDIGCETPAELARDLVRAMPAVQRSTELSVQPHLRATTTRCLLRLTKSCRELVMIMKEMPSIVPAAVSAVVSYDASTAQWEAAGSAEFLQHILTVAADDRGVDESLHISQSALPLQLLLLISKNNISYPTAAMMGLVAAIADQQSRLVSKGYQFQSVLFPHGTQSMTQWDTIAKLIINANLTLSKALKKVPPMTTTTKDSLARATAAFEELSVQFSFAATALRALRLIHLQNPTMAEVLDPTVLTHLITSVLVVPPPFELASAIGERYSVDVSQSGVLQRSYEEMLSCLAGFIAVYYNTKSSVPFAPLPEECVGGLITIMNCETISMVARTALCRGLSAILSLPGTQHRELLQSIAPHSRGLFLALLGAIETEPVRAARSRMLAIYEASTIAACTTGWLASVIQQAHQLSCSVRLLNNCSEEDFDDLSGLMSQIVATTGSEACRPIAAEDGTMLAAALCTLLHVQRTRLLGLQALRGIANGPQGRAVLLLEASEVEKIHRSPFAKVLQLTFGGIEKLSNQEISIGTDAISAAAAKGRDVFAQALIKLKIMGRVEENLVALDRQRSLAPIGTYRFLASVSFSGEVQCLIARRPALLTLLLEAAALQTEIGTLSLLTVRNCCFSQAVKTQLCQDTRVLQMLAGILSTNTTSLVESTQARELFRKQQLALSALWALVFHHQRGKTYVRATLQQPTPAGKGNPIVLQDLLAATTAITSSNQVANRKVAAARKQLVPGYESAMRRGIDGLKQHGLVGQ